jgi:hypothetical protein
MELYNIELSLDTQQKTDSQYKLPPLNNNNSGRNSRNLDNDMNTSNSFRQLNEDARYILPRDSNIVHHLPARNLIKLDNNEGVIDTWPAHSANQRPTNIQLALNKHNRLVITNAREEGKPDITPKPKFLENLEKFLNKELKTLGISNSNNERQPSEAKLQVKHLKHN